MLGRFFGGRRVKVVSIDFDADPERAALARKRVEGLDVQCVAGDIHEQVPRVLADHAGDRVARRMQAPTGARSEAEPSEACGGSGLCPDPDPQLARKWRRP